MKPSNKAIANTNPDYVPTDEEVALLNQYRNNNKRPKARIKILDGDVVGYDHEDQAYGQLATMDAIGTTDNDFLLPFISQLVNAATIGRELQAKPTNFMLSVVKGIQPKDQIEAMLGAQMAAVHMATMTFARRLNHVENIPQQDAAERAFNKLTRTFNSQMEALRKYRSGGEQKVTVKHVTVNDGGQAVVGNVSHNADKAGGGSGKK